MLEHAELVAARRPCAGGCETVSRRWQLLSSSRCNGNGETSMATPCEQALHWIANSQRRYAMGKHGNLIMIN